MTTLRRAFLIGQKVQPRKQPLGQPVESSSTHFPASKDTAIVKQQQHQDTKLSSSPSSQQQALPRSHSTQDTIRPTSSPPFQSTACASSSTSPSPSLSPSSAPSRSSSLSHCSSPLSKRIRILPKYLGQPAEEIEEALARLSQFQRESEGKKDSGIGVGFVIKGLSRSRSSVGDPNALATRQNRRKTEWSFGSVNKAEAQGNSPTTSTAETAKSKARHLTASSTPSDADSSTPLVGTQPSAVDYDPVSQDEGSDISQPIIVELENSRNAPLLENEITASPVVATPSSGSMHTPSNTGSHGTTITSASSTLQVNNYLQNAFMSVGSGDLAHAWKALGDAREVFPRHPLYMFLYALFLRHGWGNETDQRGAYALMIEALQVCMKGLSETPRTDFCCHADEGPPKDGQVGGVGAEDLTEGGTSTEDLKSLAGIILYELAQAFRFNWGVPRKSATLASYLYHLAAELGDVDAQRDLGYFYVEGFRRMHIPRDRRLGARYLRMAAAAAKGFGQGQTIGPNTSWIFKAKFD